MSYFFFYYHHLSLLCFLFLTLFFFLISFFGVSLYFFLIIYFFMFPGSFLSRLSLTQFSFLLLYASSCVEWDSIRRKKPTTIANVCVTQILFLCILKLYIHLQKDQYTRSNKDFNPFLFVLCTVTLRILWDFLTGSLIRVCT